MGDDPRGLRRHLTYANVMVTILAVLVVGGGGAYAAKKLKLKNNSVTSAKIRDGNVRTPDLADGAVTGPKLAAGLIGGGSIGRMDNTPGTCSPTGSGTTCVDVVLQMPRAGRVVVNADGGALYTTNAFVAGACQLFADSDSISFGVPLAGSGTTANTDHFALNGVTGVLPAGAHTFSMLCTESSTELSIVDSHLTAVALSAD